MEGLAVSWKGTLIAKNKIHFCLKWVAAWLVVTWFVVRVLERQGRVQLAVGTTEFVFYTSGGSNIAIKSKSSANQRLAVGNVNVVVTARVLRLGWKSLVWSSSISMQSGLHDIILPYNDSKNLTEINGDNIIPESCHSICRNILAIKTSHCVPFPSRGSLTFLWFLKASDR